MAPRLRLRHRPPHGLRTRRDIPLFPCLLALEVRRGALEVYALAFLTTHVHLLARVLRVALLRDLAGLRYAAMAQRCGTSITEAHTCYRQHAARLLEDPSYAGACGSIARATLVILHRPRPRAR